MLNYLTSPLPVWGALLYSESLMFWSGGSSHYWHWKEHTFEFVPQLQQYGDMYVIYFLVILWKVLLISILLLQKFSRLWLISSCNTMFMSKPCSIWQILGFCISMLWETRAVNGADLFLLYGNLQVVLISCASCGWGICTRGGRIRERVHRCELWNSTFHAPSFSVI